MNKTIWYGAKDNDVRFADNKAVLTSQGIDNAQSFTVNGDVSGLELIGQTNPATAGAQAQPQG